MASDIGQGSDTVLKQILADELGLGMDDIYITSADTAMTPKADLGTWGSRVTLMAGNAIMDAAKQIKEKLFGILSMEYDLNVVYDLECSDGKVYVKDKPERSLSFAEAVEKYQRTSRGKPLVVRGHYTPRGEGLVSPAFSFGTQISKVKVDGKTGETEVKETWTAHDCGTVINKTGVEGQLEGSLQMGLGYALSEHIEVDENGKTLNETLLDYHMPNSLEMPDIESASIETYEPEGPKGAKEAGEGLVVPVAPAIAEAVHHATGYCAKKLPIKPGDIVESRENEQTD